MTVTTPIYWEADGSPLSTYAYNISTLGGDRDKPTNFRGDDVTIPFRAGQLWMPKIPDAQTLTLGMWVQGCDEDGVIPRRGSEQRAVYERNMRKLRHLLWTPSRQFKLTKRFYDDSGNIVVADALAQFTSGLSPEMLGSAHGVFTVDLKLCDPFFYGRLPVKVSLTSAKPQRTVEILGDAATSRVTITFASGTTPKLANGPVSVWMTSNVPSGAKVVVDCDQSKVYRSDTKASLRSTFAHDGAHQWFPLEPGSATLKASVGSGAVSTTCTYYPAYH